MFQSPLRQSAFLLLMSCLAFGSVGCYRTMQLGISSTKSSNSGRPFYVMVRKADEKTYISEDYKAVSNKLFSYPKDKSIIERKVIIPGQFVEMSIKKPAEVDIAIYFFFTDYGENWRLSVNQPFYSQMLIDLGSNQIKRVRVQKR
ncbi:MAG: hypothetical protein VYC39_07025 [Myxococcota bacterium]|nr:hypothetical protein [Myxococcota bacterium]